MQTRSRTESSYISFPLNCEAVLGGVGRDVSALHTSGPEN